MSKNRYISTRFWDDVYIAGLDPAGKLLFIYLLTNPLTEIAGVYEIALHRIAYDTGLKADKVGDLLAQFEASGKIIYRAGWIVLVNFIKHQGNSPKIQKGIEVSINRAPDWVKEGFRIGFDTLSNHIDKARYDTNYLNSNSNCNNSRELLQARPEASPNKKGSRIPPGFCLDADLTAWTLKNGRGIDISLELQKFKNHWETKPGKDGIKLDWRKTWQNWVLNAKNWSGSGPGGNNKNGTNKNAIAEGTLESILGDADFGFGEKLGPVDPIDAARDFFD